MNDESSLNEQREPEQRVELRQPDRMADPAHGGRVELVGPAGMTEGLELEPDVQRIVDLLTRAVEDGPVDGAELLRAVFDQRFAVGVRMKGATGSAPGASIGSGWLFTERGPEGPGWLATQTWDDVADAADVAGTGGLTLLAADGRDVAVFIHNGRDGIARVMVADLFGNHRVIELDDYRQTHAAPRAVVSIDQCGDVHA
jgi:hypothetical protein